MTDFKELCLKRESCRAYDGRPVPKELLEELCETALLAPSARNYQPWVFRVCTGNTAKRIFSEALAAHGWNTWTETCPAIIVIESETRQTERLGIKYDMPVIDCGIVLAYLALAAAEKGLGTCIIGAEDEQKIKEILSIPTEKRIYCSIAVGWPAEPGVRAKARKPLSEAARFDD